MSQSLVNALVEEREFDHLYDPNYHVSGVRDHERTKQKTMAKLNRMEKIFSFHNMFSEIPIYKPYEWRLSVKDPVPASVSREFRPEEICGKLIKKHLEAALGCDPREDIIGRNRSKYFASSVMHAGPMPLNNMVNVDAVIESMTTGKELLSLPWHMKRRRFSNKKVQTDFRDSEAQTDPYSPPYVVNVGETPEVLTLATLGYGKGLPAALHDVEMIERARDRRRIEANLPSFGEIAHKPSKVLKRQKLLQDMELREWHYREREVEALQEVRMKVLTELLRKREEHQQEIAQKRLDHVWQERLAAKEAHSKTIRRQYISALRKLIRKRLNKLKSPRKRDIISDYSTPSSQVFAPLTRLGVFPDRSADNFKVDSPYLNSYEGLLELEASLPPDALHRKIHIPPIEVYTKDGFLRRDFRHQYDLAKLQEYLEGAFKINSETVRKPRFLEKIVKPPPRPITPSVKPPSEEMSLERETATVFLQSLIRGRAIQTQMYEGKEKRRDLIAELRSTHALLEDDQAEKARQKHRILETQAIQAEFLHEEDIVDDVVCRYECGTLADMLDFCSKELDRLLEERRVHAMVILAERHRRMREAEESGTRQREERRRREQDEIFKQLVKVHQETVDGYLADVAGIVIDSTAGQIAETEVEEFAEKLDEAARKMETARDPLQSELIAADLVHNFIIPEVNKRSYRKMLEARQRPFLEAAHREIWGPTHEAAAVEREYKPPTPDSADRHNCSTMTDPTNPIQDSKLD